MVVVRVVVAGVLAALVAGCADDGRSPEADGSRSGAVPASAASASCAESYGPATLGERAFALDGIVISIGRPTAAGSGSMFDVTFDVGHWYRHGSGEPPDEVTLQLSDPSGAPGMSEFAAAYDVGTRLLVSGEERPDGGRLVWYCGFTRYWSARAADRWEEAFAGRSARSAGSAGSAGGSGPSVGEPVRVVVYDAVEPPRSGSRRGIWGELVAREATVRSSGDAGLDALRARRPHPGRRSPGPTFETFTEARSVVRADGLVTVALVSDPWDPFAMAYYVGPPGDLVVQELVRTVQTALETSDPVLFTVGGVPVRGFLGVVLDGPVGADLEVAVR